MNQLPQKKKRSLKDRLLKAGPAIGATIGGAAALAAGRPKAALSGALTGAGVGWLPDIYNEGYKSVKSASVKAFWDELEKIAAAPSRTAAATARRAMRASTKLMQQTMKTQRTREIKKAALIKAMSKKPTRRLR